jgi:hypothetical protein
MAIEDDDAVDDGYEDLGDDDEGFGADSEDAEGQDPGDGDEEGSLSAGQLDAPSEEEHERTQGEGETEVRRPAEPAPQSRGSRRVQQLLRREAEARARAEQAERERDDFRRQAWQNNQRETQAQREARLAVMSPEERTAYEWREWQQGVDGQVQRMRVEGAMELDKLKFEANAARNPLYAKWADKVEEVFRDRMRQGLPMANREVIMDYLIGKSARESASRSTREARRDGQRRIKAAETRPGSSRGDAATTRGSKRVSTAESRLRGVEI